MIMQQEVIEYSSATRMAEVYQQATARIRELAVELGKVSRGLHDLFVENGAYSYDFTFNLEYHSNRYSVDAEGVDRVIAMMKKDAWQCLVRKLDIRKIMSSDKQSMLDAQLEGKSVWYDRDKGEEVQLGPLPDITADNIMQVLTGMVESSGEMLEGKIREEFRFWKAWASNGYKTNDPNMVGEKVIKGYMVEYAGWQNTYWRPSHGNEKHLQAIDHVFHLLDGKGIPKEYDGALVTAIKKSGVEGTGSTDYFKFKCFRNGNLHLRFLNLDLLAQFNRVAGGGNLPQPHEKSRGTSAV